MVGLVATTKVNALHVLLVRHGESINNPIYGEIFNPVSKEPPNSEARQAAEADWLARRLDDPPLTSKGENEARLFSSMYAPRVAKAVGPGGKVRVFVSPCLRTLQTAEPLVKSLGPERCTVEVQPDIYEVGGVYSVSKDGKRGGPGKCLSRAGISSRFPTYGTSALKTSEDEGWYTGGWETDAEARVRADRVAKWLRSPELQASCANPKGAAWTVLVLHGHLIDLLMKALLGVQDDPQLDQEHTNSIAGRAVVVNMPNTAVGHITVLSEENKGSVIMHFLGRTDHLTPVPALPSQSSAGYGRSAASLLGLGVGMAVGMLLAIRKR